MRFDKFLFLVLITTSLSLSAKAATLTFVAQSIGGNLDDNWFNAANWFVPDNTGNLVPAGRVPLADEQAIVTGTVDLQASGVRVQALVATNNAVITNGTLAVENLQLLSGASIEGATVNVLAFVTIAGTNCTLQASTMSILGIASGSFTPAPPANATSLVLTQGALLVIGGSLGLTDHSLISGAGQPQSKVLIEPGAQLVSSNSASLVALGTDGLAVDNSGMVRCDGGTLLFDGSIAWQSSGNLGEFRAANSAATILFKTAFHADPGVTSVFTGPGTNRWQTGATIDGVAQISAIDSSTQLAGPGWLEVAGPVSGAGTLYVLGTTNTGGTANWTSGTVSLPSVGIDPGANLLINGGGGHQLQGCIVTNLGQCTFFGGNLDFAQSAVINNQTGARFVVQSDGSFSSSSSGGLFNNFGTFQKLSSGTMALVVSNAIPGPDFNNTGVVDVQAGQLNLLGGLSAGEFRQSQGTLLWFWGGVHQLNPGATFTGNSSVRVMQGALPVECLLNDALKFTQLEIGVNGTVDATGAPANTPIQITSLLTHENAVLTNAAVQVGRFDMRDGTTVVNATVNIGTALSVQSTNCTLSASTLNLPIGATGILAMANGRTNGVLTLSRGTVFNDAGQFTLSDGTAITGGATPSSRIQIASGGVLTGTNSTAVAGTANAPLAIDNSGAIQVTGGNLVLGGGLSWASSSGTGEFRATGANDVITFAGAFDVPLGVVSVFSGAGTNYWVTNVTIEGTAQIAGAQGGSQGNLQITGSVNGTGTLHVVGNPSQSGRLFWNSGTLAGLGITIDSLGQFDIGGDPALTRNLSGITLNNSGVCRWIGGDLSLAATVVNNLPGADCFFKTNVSLLQATSSQASSFNNAGLVDVSANGNLAIGPSFANSGSLQVHSGNVAFQNGWVQAQGTTAIDAGATLAATNLMVQGGTITGQGTIAANVLNVAGTVSPGAPFGVLNIGPTQLYQQGPAASLAIILGGPASGTQFDDLAVGGTVSLNGQLSVGFTNGFVPQPGQVFQILSGSAISGKFSQIISPPIPGGTWLARYGPQSVTLVLANQVTLPRPTVVAGALSFAISTTAGVQYLVQATDEWNQVNWQTLTTLNGDGTVQTASEPMSQAHRFYRVLMQ